MGLFRFPRVTIDVDPTQVVAVRADDGRFYNVTVQSIIDLAATEGSPSITDDGTDVEIDANLNVTGDTTLGGAFIPNLPTVDPEVEGQAWMDAGVFSISSGPP